jgi:hypothetical protein
MTMTPLRFLTAKLTFSIGRAERENARVMIVYFSPKGGIWRPNILARLSFLLFPYLYSFYCAFLLYNESVVFEMGTMRETPFAKAKLTSGMPLNGHGKRRF